MYELKKNGKVFTSKFVGTGPSSYEKRIYQAVVLQRLRNTAVSDTMVRAGSLMCMRFVPLAASYHLTVTDVGFFNSL